MLGCIAFSGLNAATFTSIHSGNWSAVSTWSVSGSDPDGIPDSNDNVIITGFTVTNNVANCYAKSITINPTGTYNLNSKKTQIYGSFTQNGTLLGSGNIFFRAAGTLSASSPITNVGDWYFYSNYTIAAGTSVVKSNYFNIQPAGNVINNGNISLYSGSLALYGAWTNASGSSLLVAGNITGGGTLNASATPNTVTYSGPGANSILTSGASYYNLTLSASSAHTKTVSSAASLSIGNTLNINSGVTLNCNSTTINIGGDWSNNANTTCTNMSTVNFNTSGTHIINRSASESFNTINLNGGTLTLNTAIVCSGSLNINSGTLNVSGANRAITLRGNFINSGTFIGQNGTVTLNGTSAQSIGGTSSTTFHNLTCSNAAGVTVNSTVQLDNLLTVSAGNFGPSASGSVHLTATGPTTYARIGVVGGTLSGTSWVIDSYIDGPATAYWQYLSTPVNGNTINDWDSDNRFYMSGVGGNDGTACCPTFYSVRTYNTSTNTYSNVTSIGTSITRGRGYMVWMGDNLSSLTAPLVYDNRGTPNFGNVTRSVTAGGSGAGYNLVGNPYACPVNYSSVQAASGNIGASFMILQENGSYVTNPNGGVIAPSQGFMCIASSTGNMTFTEACKNTSSVPNIIRQAEPMNYVRINVTNDQNGLGGETAIQFNDQARNGYDLSFDMPYLPSPYETASNLWTTDRDGKDNILNALDAGSDVLEIPLTVQAAVDGNQTITFRGINHVTSYSCAWMENTETGERINLREKDSYSFFASAGSKSSFILHFDRTGNNCPLDQQNITESLDAQTQVYVSNDQLMAKFFFTEATDVQIVIYDAEGREVAVPKQYTVSSESIALQSPGAHGVYFVQVIQADRVTTKKIYY